jgi:hypothetical protein
VSLHEHAPQPEAHLTVSRLFESLTPARAAVVYLGLTLCAASAVQGAFRELSRSSEPSASVKKELVSGAIWFPSIVLGMLVVLALGYLVTFAWYRQKVRPRLLARAPLKAGGRARCRACGTELAPSDEPLRVCSDCHSVNV